MIPKTRILLAAVVLATASAHAQTISLFRDDFTRPNNTNLNASDAGQSGLLAPLDWVEKNLNAGTAVINGNELRIDSAGSGNSGAIVYPDQNFNCLSSLTVTMDIATGGSGGNGRVEGFGLGYSKSGLDGKTSGTNAGFSAGSDIFFGYDAIGTSKFVYVQEDGGTVFTGAIASPAHPVNLRAECTFADMDDGTTIFYEVFLNGSSIWADSTTWTGADQNYIGFCSNYTLNTDIEFIEIEGIITPPAPLSKADNANDLDLASSWVTSAVPGATNVATWDSSVTAANTTFLGTDQTWGGIAVQNPGGLVTISPGNILSLDGPPCGAATAIDLSMATTDLNLNADLALTGTSNWEVASGRTLSVGGVVSGDSSISTTGGGTVVLSGSNDYTGATVVRAGTVQLGASEVIPHGGGTSASGNLTVDGTLDLNTFSESLNGLNGSGVIDTVAGGNPTLEVGSNGQPGTFNGILQNTAGTLNLTKVGTNTLVLGGANTMSGAVSVDGGILAFTNTSPFDNASSLALAGGTSLRPGVAGATVSAPVTVGTTGTNATISGPTVSSGGNGFTVAGVISGAGNVVLDSRGPGNAGSTIILNGASTYAGETRMTCSIGTNSRLFVRLGTENALPTTTVLTMDCGNGAGSGRQTEIDLNGNNQTLAGLTSIVGANRVQRVVNNSGTASTLTINNADDYTFAEELGDGQNGDNNFGLTKSGSGTFTLSGSVLYSGDTTVTGGVLSLGGANPNNDASTFTIADTGATVEMTFATSDTVNELFIGATLQPAGLYGHTSSGADNGGQGVGALNSYFTTGSGTLNVLTGAAGSNAFDTWATSNGVPTGSEAVDSDSGGLNNLGEFGLGGNPTNGNDDGSLLHAFSEDVIVGGDPEGVLTILVRNGASFTSAGDPAVSDAAVDGITYSVAADTTPDVGGGGLTVTPTAAVTTGLPAAPAGYKYVSFYISGAEGYFQVTVAPE